MLPGYIVEMSSWALADHNRLRPARTHGLDDCHIKISIYFLYIVKNLYPDRVYIFRVKAQNIHGPSVSFMKSDDDFMNMRLTMKVKMCSL